jgi:hypothetical protein
MTLDYPLLYEKILPCLLQVVLVFTAAELLGLIIFAIVRRIFRNKNQPKTRNSSTAVTILKGMLERGFILVGLLFEFPQVLTLLGALKIGTRLDTDKSQRISNDYFLIGNLVSILLALLTYKIITLLPLYDFFHQGS